MSRAVSEGRSRAHPTILSGPVQFFYLQKNKKNKKNQPYKSFFQPEKRQNDIK